MYTNLEITRANIQTQFYTPIDDRGNAYAAIMNMVTWIYPTSYDMEMSASHTWVYKSLYNWLWAR